MTLTSVSLSAIMGYTKHHQQIKVHVVKCTPTGNVGFIAVITVS